MTCVIYIRNDALYADINECAKYNGWCPEHSTCKNTPGSYECNCDEGYTAHGSKCVGQSMSSLQVFNPLHLYFTGFLRGFVVVKLHVVLYLRALSSTRSSAIAEGPRDAAASCLLKSCQLPRNSAQTLVGQVLKRFIDHIKANLLKCNIKPSDLEVLASDRDIWRTVCDTGLRSFANGWTTSSEERRAASTKQKTSPRCPQCSRVCASDFGLRSHMRSHDKTGST